jgi:hypothetical protein
MPRAMRAACRLCGEVPTDPEVTHLRVPLCPAFPLLPDHDCLLRQTLDEGIFGTRESAQHVLREPRNRGCVLRNPASVFLGNDPERVTRQGLNEVSQSLDIALMRNSQGVWILTTAAWIDRQALRRIKWKCSSNISELFSLK